MEMGINLSLKYSFMNHDDIILWDTIDRLSAVREENFYVSYVSNIIEDKQGSPITLSISE